MDIAACEQFASTIGTWEPTPWQGTNSYTLHNKEKAVVLQFRGPNESLYDETCRLAAKIHNGLAPHAKCLGSLPNNPAKESIIWVWQMDRLPGDPYLFHASSLSLNQVSTAVADLAKFFAAAWKQPQYDIKIQPARSGYVAIIEELLTTLPVEYHAVLNLVLVHLDDILTLRPVLTHGDISSGNLLIDPKSGHLTGVVDWAEATIEPFGLGLWGLQDIIGVHYAKGYSYLYDAKANRDLFLQTFLQEASIGRGDGDMQHLEWACLMRNLERARLLGVLRRYGYVWDSSANKRVPIKHDEHLKYLTLCIQGYIFDNIITIK